MKLLYHIAIYSRSKLKKILPPKNTYFCNTKARSSLPIKNYDCRCNVQKEKHSHFTSKRRKKQRKVSQSFTQSLFMFSFYNVWKEAHALWLAPRPLLSTRVHCVYSKQVSFYESCLLLFGLCFMLLHLDIFRKQVMMGWLWWCQPYLKGEFNTLGLEYKIKIDIINTNW